MGLSQLILGLLYGVVLWRYRALIPLALVMLWLSLQTYRHTAAVPDTLQQAD